MTLTSSGATTHNASNRTEPPSDTTARTVKTAFDCDILTMARDARAHEERAALRSTGGSDPMDAFYKPLGNKDVTCIVTHRTRSRLSVAG